MREYTWAEMSYIKYAQMPQLERLKYESWDFDIDNDETRIDYEEDGEEE